MPAADPGAFQFEEGTLLMTFDLRLYTPTAIQKTAYRLAARCTAVLGPIEQDRLTVRLAFAGAMSESGALEAGRLFHQELIDQQLRERLGEETQALRALIVAHAFSRTGLVSDE